MNRYNIKIFSISALLLFAMASFVLSGCRSNDNTEDLVAPYEILFSGKIADMGAVKTRLDTAYINSSLYDTNFYIQQIVETGSGENSEFGIYHVPSGYEGRLTSVNAENPLMWQDLTSDHLFYAWTLPWDENFSLNENNTQSIPVTFYNSSDESGYNEHKNNQIMEQFLGTKAGPYSYQNNGKYVDFTFKHLVSKIKIGTFQLIEASGAIQKNLKADITFIGMPSTGTFYPNPDNGDAPYVEPGMAEENSGLIFYIANDTESDYFYICPEIDFRTINYQIKLRNEEYVNGAIDIYYGTFDNVVFQRENGTDYDIGDGSDDTVLHAGEMMTINISLIPGIGPGLAVVIDKWSTEDYDKDDETLYHTHPGLYSDSEVKNVLDLFAGMNNDNFCSNLAEMERLFELYGQEIEENDEILRMLVLYENVTVNSNIFPIYKEFILNGMGHVISMNTNYGNPGGAFGSNSNYFNIGPARDVYLSNPQGTVKLYIDADGFVWTYNADTNQYTQTQNQLTELDDNQKSYDIDATTGIVRKSNYFNNGLGENPTPFPSCD